MKDRIWVCSAGSIEISGRFPVLMARMMSSLLAVELETFKISQNFKVKEMR